MKSNPKQPADDLPREFYRLADQIGMREATEVRATRGIVFSAYRKKLDGAGLTLAPCYKLTDRRERR